MKVTFQGSPITLNGTQVKVGDTAPDFTVTYNDLNDFKLSDTKGKRVFLTVPSLDTPVCDTEVRRFNTEASKLDGVTIYTILWIYHLLKVDGVVVLLLIRLKLYPIINTEILVKIMEYT